MNPKTTNVSNLLTKINTIMGIDTKNPKRHGLILLTDAVSTAVKIIYALIMSLLSCYGISSVLIIVYGRDKLSRYVDALSRCSGIEPENTDVPDTILLRRDPLSIVLATSHALLRNDSLFMNYGPDLLVTTEGSFIAHQGKTGKLLTALGEHSDFRIVISGENTEYKPADQFHLCHFLDPDIFGDDERHFLDKYSISDEYGNFDQYNSETAPEMREHIDSVTVNATSSDETVSDSDASDVLRNAAASDSAASDPTLSDLMEQIRILDFAPLAYALPAALETADKENLTIRQFLSLYFSLMDEQTKAGKA